MVSCILIIEPNEISSVSGVCRYSLFVVHSPSLTTGILLQQESLFKITANSAAVGFLRGRNDVVCGPVSAVKWFSIFLQRKSLHFYFARWKYTVVKGPLGATADWISQWHVKDQQHFANLAALDGLVVCPPTTTVPAEALWQWQGMAVVAHSGWGTTFVCLFETCLLTWNLLMIRADQAIQEGVETLMLKTCSLTMHGCFAFAGLHHLTILTCGDLPPPCKG